MWLIFAPSTDKKEKEQQTQGLNTNLPMPEEKGLVGNKREAYEQEAIRQKDKDKKRSLSDFAFLLEEEQSKKGQDRSFRRKVRSIGLFLEFARYRKRCSNKVAGQGGLDTIIGGRLSEHQPAVGIMERSTESGN